MSAMFTVEESNLICVFAEESIAPDTKSRAKVIQDISNTVKYLDDDGIIELSKQVVAKLDTMSDEEFAELEFIAAE